MVANRQAGRQGLSAASFVVAQAPGVRVTLSPPSAMVALNRPRSDDSPTVSPLNLRPKVYGLLHKR